jgi:hypothetical protein
VLRGAARVLSEDRPVIMAEVFNYDVFGAQRPSIVGKVDAENTLRVEELMRGHGYTAYAVGSQGLLRVRDLRSMADGGSNYVFAPRELRSPYLPYSKPEWVADLFARAS